MTNLKVLNVEKYLDWVMLTAYYRGYLDKVSESSIYNRYVHLADGYDVIVGFIADDRMYQVMTDFFECRITDTALVGSLSALKLGRQYVAVTQKACSQIKTMAQRHLCKLELLILRDKSTARRREGISSAERIGIEHRRDGRFFDEIQKEDQL